MTSSTTNVVPLPQQGRLKDTYNEPKTFELPGAVVKVYSPVLTEEERKRRMAQIAKSAAALLKQK